MPGPARPLPGQNPSSSGEWSAQSSNGVERPQLRQTDKVEASGLVSAMAPRPGVLAFCCLDLSVLILEIL